MLKFEIDLRYINGDLYELDHVLSNMLSRAATFHSYVGQGVTARTAHVHLMSSYPIILYINTKWQSSKQFLKIWKRSIK